MNNLIRCANPSCRRLFLPNPQVKNQQYCKKKACQRLRKNLWQKHKMASDADYQDNQQGKPAEAVGHPEHDLRFVLEVQRSDQFMQVHGYLTWQLRVTDFGATAHGR